MHVYCDGGGNNVEAVYFYPFRNKEGGLVITYNSYVKITSAGREFKNEPIRISGYYEKSDKTFTISGIIYHPEK